MDSLQPAVSALISAIAVALAVTASLRFPLALAPYVMWYYAVSLGSFLCALAGFPEASGLVLVLALAGALFFAVFPGRVRLQRGLKESGAVVPLLLVLFFWSALFPAHDPDSMNIHLEWGRQVLLKGLWFEPPAWFTGRLAGMGEWLALSGLSLGLDNLQALLGWGALVVFLVDVTRLFREQQAPEVFALAVLTLPVLLFLVPSQKPQLIGSLAVAWSAIYLMQRVERIPPAIGLGMALFATTVKASFWVTALVPAAAWMLRLWRRQQREGRVTVAPWLVLLVPAPLLLWNLVRWSDPLPPMLTDYLGLQGGYLSGYVRSFNNGWDFPFNLVLPRNAGQLTAVLGPAVLLWVLVLFSNRIRGYRRGWWAATALAVAFSPAEARFYLEFALVGLFLAADGGVAAVWWRRFRPVLWGMAAAAAAVLLLFAAPRSAALAGTRHDFMSRFAFGYEPVQWARRIIPEQAAWMSGLPARYFLPAEAVGPDLTFELKRDARLWQNVARDSTVWILTHDDPDLYAAMAPGLTLTPVAETTFLRRTRNPANAKRETYRIFTARLKPTP